MEKYLKAYWKQIVVVVVFIIILIAVYMYAKKKGNNLTVVDDNGNVIQPSAADIAKANSLANRLKNDLAGLNYLGHDDSIYNELSIQSNTVFAMVFTKYEELTGTSLVADINDDYFDGWEVIDVITNRATELNIS